MPNASKRATKKAERKARKRAEKIRRAKDAPAATKKERFPILGLDFGSDATITGISAPNERGEVVFYGSDGQPLIPRGVSVATAYPRPKGPKILTQFDADPENILLDVHHVLTRFDYIFAVDTNTKTIAGDLVCVCAFVVLTEVVVDGQRWSVKPISQDRFEFREPSAPPERIGWHRLLESIAVSDLEGTIAIFVDSELGALDALNRREQELVPGRLLPPNVSLFYASTDAGRSDLVGNRVLGECDKLANEILRKLEAGEAPPKPLVPARGLYKSCRVWPVSASDTP
jgi:hypothetical protein